MKKLRRITIHALFITLLMFLASCAPGLENRYTVNGQAMEPNFHQGQEVNIASANTSTLQRGDVILMEYNGQTFLKRIIGLPGETVTISPDKPVLINSAPLDEPYISVPTSVSPGDNTSVTLKQDEFYVLGDNRPNSSDSRELGPVMATMIKGKVKP